MFLSADIPKYKSVLVSFECTTIVSTPGRNFVLHPFYEQNKSFILAYFFHHLTKRALARILKRTFLYLPLQHQPLHIYHKYNLELLSDTLFKTFMIVIFSYFLTLAFKRL